MLQSIVALSVIAGLSSSTQAQWSANQWQAQRLGYTDGIHTRADGQQQGLIRGSRLNLNGLVVGVSERYRGQDLIGATAWASTLGQPLRRIGFFDAEHTSSFGDQNSETGAAVGRTPGDGGFVNGIGQTIGYSTRYDGAFENGRTAWLWDPTAGTTRLGVTGGVFTSSFGEEFSQPIAFDDIGRVIGYSRRFVPDVLLGSVVPASSAWIQSPGGPPTMLDLAGSSYVRSFDGFARHEPRSMNNSGIVVGISYRFDASGSEAGQAAWRWTHTTGTERVGPQGPRYTGPDSTEYAYVGGPTAAGDLTGGAWTFFESTTEVGRDTWLIRAGAATPELIGLRGPDHTRADGYQYCEPTAYRVEGPLRIAGYAQLFLDQGEIYDGRSSWSWTPTEGAIEIGLRDAEHQTPAGARDGFPIVAMPGGHIAGYSFKLGASNFDRVGQSTWVWSPPTPASPQGQTRRLGLFDPLHTATNGYQTSEIYGTNNAGQIFGVSYRYNGRSQFDGSAGRTIWVFDIATGTQTDIVFSASPTDDAIALPLGMSADGVLYGYYLEYQGEQIIAQRAFAWSAQCGVTTINSLLQNGPLSQQVENCFFTDALDDAAGRGLMYAMPEGVLWTPAGSGWATGYRLVRSGGTTCDSIDFNNDGSLFDPQDIEAFLSVYSEGPCVPETNVCNDIDFNNDGSVFDPCDIDSFLLLYSEGPCTLCGV